MLIYRVEFGLTPTQLLEHINLLDESSRCWIQIVRLFMWLLCIRVCVKVWVNIVVLYIKEPFRNIARLFAW